MVEQKRPLTAIPSGRYSPLRYPGGKGKLAKFLKEIIKQNSLADGRYVEPYAGGAAIAWELLLTGVVKRISINDISKPVYAFWHSVMNRTDELCDLVEQTPLTVEEWDKQKQIYRNADLRSSLKLGFAFFYLNRTNRSGILNGGIIGGRAQNGKWGIDARYNREALARRISMIGGMKDRVTLSNLDAETFLETQSKKWGRKTLVYLDPPYYEKGRFLYHDSYKPEDHTNVANSVCSLENLKWIVSYDDVRPIHELYEDFSWLQYTLNYSARNKVRGREAMFFSHGMTVPEVPTPLIELDRQVVRDGVKTKPVGRRSFVLS